jgi:chromosomal replication initiator protein
VGIIQRKAQLMHINIPEDVVFFIANQLKSNIRQLEGVVKKLQAYVILQDSEPTIAVAQAAIRDIRNDDQPEPVTVSRIISEVSRTYSVGADDLRSKKRDAPISKARQVAMYIVREITGMPVSTIGEEFGGRDHSTIVYAIDQVKRLMSKNPKEKATIEDIIKNIQDN